MTTTLQPFAETDFRPAHGPTGLRVLLVEDEAMVALNLEALVEDLGHTVTGVAASREQALDLAGCAPPQVAVVDVNLLDGRTGPQIADRLAAAFGTVVVIATGNPEGIVSGGAVFAVLRKPYTDEALAEIIRRAADAAARRGERA